MRMPSSNWDRDQVRMKTRVPTETTSSDLYALFAFRKHFATKLVEHLPKSGQGWL